MSVYVDKIEAPYGRMVMCHMMADSLAELHRMADAIGVNRRWFQNKKTPHYDICKSKKEKAIQLGAIEVDHRKIHELIQFWKHQKGKTNQ